MPRATRTADSSAIQEFREPAQRPIEALILSLLMLIAAVLGFLFLRKLSNQKLGSHSMARNPPGTPEAAYIAFALVDALTRISGRMVNAGDRLEIDAKAAQLLALAA